MSRDVIRGVLEGTFYMGAFAGDGLIEEDVARREDNGEKVYIRPRWYLFVKSTIDSPTLAPFPQHL